MTLRFRMDRGVGCPSLTLPLCAPVLRPVSYHPNPLRYEIPCCSRVPSSCCVPFGRVYPLPRSLRAWTGPRALGLRHRLRPSANHPGRHRALAGDRRHRPQPVLRLFRRRCRLRGGRFTRRQPVQDPPNGFRRDRLRLHRGVPQRSRCQHARRSARIRRQLERGLRPKPARPHHVLRRCRPAEHPYQ